MKRNWLKLYVELLNREVSYEAGSIVKGHIYLEVEHEPVHDVRLLQL
jgi:hypothetical protein